MAIIDEKGQAVDVWFTAARKHESKTLRERLYHSSYLRKLFRHYEVLRDKAYRGVNSVTIYESKELKGIKRRIASFFTKVRFLEYSGWRYLKTLLIYLTAIGIATYYPF